MAASTHARRATTRTALAFASAIALGAGAAAASDEPRSGDELQSALDKIGRLEATVERLNSRLGELEQEGGERWLSEERAAQIRAVVTDVLADAETRSSYQSDAALAGYAPGKGFYIQTADGNYSMRITGQLQTRYVLNNAGDQRTDYGFQIRRVKVAFSGNIVDETWTYKIQGAFNRGSNSVSTSNTSNFLLEEAWIGKDLGDGFSLRLGQFKSPWLQEDIVSSRRLLTVERSLLAGYFQQNFNRGLQLQWQTDQFRLRAWTGNGIQSPFRGGSNSVISSNWNTNPTAYAFVARGEAKFGDAGWADFLDFNSFRGAKSGVMLGVSGLYQRYNDGVAFGNPTASIVSGITGDVTVNFGGASLFAYAVWEGGQDATSTSGQPLGNQNPWGFLVQGGYFLAEDFEVFGRYEYGSLDAGRPIYTDNDLNLVTVGFNWFFKRNDLKFTLDWGINLDSLGLPSYGSGGYGSNSGAGYRTDLPGQELQWSLRAQMQLLF